jgi:hypothetical protein
MNGLYYAMVNIDTHFLKVNIPTHTILTLQPFWAFHSHHPQSPIYIVSQRAALNKRDDPQVHQQPITTKKNQ